jgi:hypothetical protein
VSSASHSARDIAKPGTAHKYVRRAAPLSRPLPLGSDEMGHRHTTTTTQHNTTNRQTKKREHEPNPFGWCKEKRAGHKQSGVGVGVGGTECGQAIEGCHQRRAALLHAAHIRSSTAQHGTT